MQFKELVALLVATCLVIAISVAFVHYLDRCVEVRTEENCVEFYDKRNHITNECEIYKDKLQK